MLRIAVCAIDQLPLPLLRKRFFLFGLFFNDKAITVSYAIIWRLAGKLKKAFSHQSICIVGDALYACRPVMDICRANKWQFILTFKEGRSPKVHEAVQAAKARCGGFSFLERPDDGGGPSAKGIVSWVDARECSYDLGEELDFRAVTYFCWDRIDGRYCGQFATGFEVSDSKRAECIAMWGRVERSDQDETLPFGGMTGSGNGAPMDMPHHDTPGGMGVRGRCRLNRRHLDWTDMDFCGICP